MLGRRRLALVISADRFIHHMVRNIVGSAVAVGEVGGHRNGAEVLAGRSWRAGATAPARGLALLRVVY